MKYIYLLIILTTLSFKVSNAIFKTTDLNIQLTKQNLITLRGEINEQLTSDIIRQLNRFSQSKLYFYITSPGGSVLDGIQIIDQLKSLVERKVELICIADFAASMAFAIFQSCPTRYVTSSSILMQHQMSLRMKGNLYNLDNYLSFIKEIDLDLDQMQSKKIGLTIQDFQTKITNDWWISGPNIIKQNIADSLILVNCESNIVDTTDEIIKTSLFFDIKIIFSKCPISREPIDIIIKTKIESIKNNDIITNFIDTVIPSQFIGKLLNH